MHSSLRRMPRLLFIALLALWLCFAQSLRLPVSLRRTAFTAPPGRAKLIRPLGSSVSVDGGSHGSYVDPPTLWSRLQSGGNSIANSGNLARSALLLVSVLPITNTTIHSMSEQVNTIKPYVPSFPFKTLKRWWASHADKRAALKTALMPVLLHHAERASQTLPVVTERVSQYAQPSLSLLAALTVLKTSSGLALLRGAFKTSVAVGVACLCRDMYLAGTKWRSLDPRNDSYAVITGADHGIGREMSRQLYQHGYNLILVGQAEDALRELQQQLREEREQIHSNSTSGRTTCSVNGCVTLQSSAQVQEQVSLLPATSTRYSWNVLGSFVGGSKGSVVNSTTPAGVSLASCASVACNPVAPKKNMLSFMSKQQPKTAMGVARTTVSAPLDTATPATSVTTTTTTVATAPLRAPHIQVIATDYAQPSAPYTVLTQIAQKGLSDKVEILVNAAETRRPSPLLTSPLPHLHHTLQANIHYTLTLTRLLAPLIVQRVNGGVAGRVSVVCSGGGGGGRSGSVVRVFSSTIRRLFNRRSSTAGASPAAVSGGGRILFVNSLTSPGPVPGDSVYAASKAFIASFAQSLRRELLPHGVMVTHANIGAVRYPHQHASRYGGGGSGTCTGSSGDTGSSTESTDGAVFTTTTIVVDSGEPNLATDTGRITASTTDTTEEHPHAPLVADTTDLSHTIDVDSMCITPANTPKPLYIAEFPALPPLPRTSDEVAAGLSEPTSSTHSASAEEETKKCRQPLLHRIPCCSLSADEAGRAVYAALRTGRDATTPGALSKLYLHALRPLLPPTALGALAQAAQLPTPDWTLHKLLDQHTAVSKSAGSTLSAAAKHVSCVPGHMASLLSGHDKIVKSLSSNLALWGAAYSASLESVVKWAEEQAPDEQPLV